MSNPRYPEEFKIEAVKQAVKRGLPAANANTWIRVRLSKTL